MAVYGSQWVPTGPYLIAGPTLAGRLDIRRAEIYLFIRVESDDDADYM